MEEIIKKLTDENLFRQAIEQFKLEKNKPADFELNIDNFEVIKDFFQFYIPNLFSMLDDDYIQLLMKVDEEMSELLLMLKPVKINRIIAMKLLEQSNELLETILKQNPGLGDEEFLRFVLSDDRKYVDALYGYLNYDFVLDELISRLEQGSISIKVNLIEQLSLTNDTKIKLFQNVDFSSMEIPTKFLNDEIIVSALLKSKYKLPKNAIDIPVSILEKNSNLVIKYIRERVNYYMSSEKELIYKIFQSELLVSEYIKSGSISTYLFVLIPDTSLHVLEQNIDIIEQNIGYSKYNLINNTTRKSKIFFEKFWSGNLELFDSELVASEVEFLFQNGFDFKHIIGNGRQIFKNSQFIRNSIDYQIKNNMELTAINYAIEEAFDNNIIYAIKNGFDYKNVPTKFFNSFIFVQYLIDNNELDFLISSLTIEQVLKYEIQLAEFVTLRDDNYGNFLSSSVIVKKLLSECNYDFSLLKKVRLYGVSDLSKWVAFTEELYDLGFRINDPSDCYAIVSSKDLALAYLKKSRDFTLVDKINILDGDITELIELAASLGYILNEKSNNVLLQQNDRIIKNSLLYGNIKYFDRIQRELTKEETDLAYSRGYVITPQSSYYFFQNAYAFEKEFELGNFDKIKFLKSDATDKLIQVYFDNGNIIDANTSPFIRANPLAIHLMFQRTNNIEVINLAISKIYREDFIKALEMGYIINENTPVGIINNNLLMSFYLEKRLEANPNLKDMIIRLASADKLGVNGAAASFDVLLTKTEITSLFSDVELVKLIKFIYFSNNTRAPLLDIIDKGNIELLKNIYDICASLSKTSDFDVSMLKNIVINFSSNEVLCRNFINQDFDTKDIQLLYNCVVNGMLHDGEVIDLESLRNYKKVIYDKNSKLLSGENLSSYTLKNSIFKLLCNKTYEEINILISQYFNVDRIDELLNSVNNESICEELKNYRVFMEFIEQIWKVEDIDSLKKILLSLNEQFLSGSKDLELIWSNFKNITLIAKRFYGEEIKEKITNFKDLEYLESTQIITGEESYDENAKVIIKKGKYRTGEYVYQGEQYNNKDVDLIELNGIPFVSFAHVLNAYGSGATLSDFKNPRLIGRTYVCLSAIDEEKFGTVSREANDMDHVTLLFSDFNSDQLALASNRDINSFGDDNDLELGGASSNLHPVRKVISDTYGGENGYNEYVMYREDSNGNIIYPSAVLITGIEPNESEIKAAAYLGVPLVKINKSKYISTNTYDITVNDITPSDLLNKQGEWLSLKKSIQEINTILSVQSNEIGEGQASKKM